MRRASPSVGDLEQEPDSLEQVRSLGEPGDAYDRRSTRFLDQLSFARTNPNLVGLEPP